MSIAVVCAGQVDAGKIGDRDVYKFHKRDILAYKCYLEPGSEITVGVSFLSPRRLPPVYLFGRNACLKLPGLFCVLCVGARVFFTARSLFSFLVFSPTIDSSLHPFVLAGGSDHTSKVRIEVQAVSNVMDALAVEDPALEERIARVRPAGKADPTLPRFSIPLGDGNESRLVGLRTCLWPVGGWCCCAGGSERMK